LQRRVELPMQLLLERIRPIPEPMPRMIWEIIVDGKTYELDFDNKHDLWVTAEGGVGQTVVVKGEWDGNFVHVASLVVDPEHVKRTVKVEVKGRLSVLYPPVVPLEELVQPARPPMDERLPIVLPAFWQIAVGDKVYSLDFTDPNLEVEAQKLAGRTVILTGVMEGDCIHVAGLKAANDEYLKVTETAVEIKGKLQYVITEWNTKKVVMVCDQLPEDMCESWVVNLGVVVDGQTYILDSGENLKLHHRAEMFVGVPVLINGKLDGNQVKDFWLNPVDDGLEVYTAK
jgi:hypothetical protein